MEKITFKKCYSRKKKFENLWILYLNGVKQTNYDIYLQKIGFYTIQIPMKNSFGWDFLRNEKGDRYSFEKLIDAKLKLVNYFSEIKSNKANE